MNDKKTKGLFRDDVKSARLIPIKLEGVNIRKYAIEVEYVDGTKEQIEEVFDFAEDAQKEINNTLKAK